MSTQVIDPYKFGGPVEITLEGNNADYDLNAVLQADHGWDGASAIDVILNVPSSATVYSTSTSTPALTAHLFTGSTLVINLEGIIAGRGGSAQAAGGDAVSLEDVDATINYETGSHLAGAGGGGGNQGSTTGGSGNDGEGGCAGSCSASGSSGGSGASTDVPPTNTAGLRGGTWGNAGTNGPIGPLACQCNIVRGAGGPGGAAGKAVNQGTGSSLTLNDNGGTIYGATS